MPLSQTHMSMPSHQTVKSSQVKSAQKPFSQMRKIFPADFRFGPIPLYYSIWKRIKMLNLMKFSLPTSPVHVHQPVAPESIDNHDNCNDLDDFIPLRNKNNPQERRVGVQDWQTMAG